jgi:hypothetical protein
VQRVRSASAGGAPQQQARAGPQQLLPGTGGAGRGTHWKTSLLERWTKKQKGWGTRRLGATLRSLDDRGELLLGA